ncbi:hypothetical protein BaRGS_00040547 [Batillaria attramentaria]|uniref:Uncharacterized protein n=1 Tax=Batillaria attramentaria TaxID=370345 RepID=A0ABD0J036_9CAEN
MASSLKGIQVLPLWRRHVPKYPVYWQGNPQLRLLMPHFWMKLVRPKNEIPNDQVRFIVHPQSDLTHTVLSPALQLTSTLAGADHFLLGKKTTSLSADHYRISGSLAHGRINSSTARDLARSRKKGFVPEVKIAQPLLA